MSMRPSPSLCTVLTCAILLFAAPLPGCTYQAGGPAPMQIDWEPDEDVTLTYGILLLDQGLREDNLEQIVTAATSLAHVSPNSRPFIDASAWLLLNRSPALAREVLEPALRRFPDDINLHLLMAEAWLEDGDGDKAIGVVNAFRLGHADSIQARQELAVLYTKAERYAEAIPLFEALPKKAYSAFVRYCYARALEETQKTDAAIAQLRKTVADMPDFLEAWLDLARLLEDRKEFRQAAVIYEHVLEQESGNNQTWMRLMNAYIADKDLSSAMEVAKNYNESVGPAFPAVSVFLSHKLYNEAESLLMFMAQKPDAPEEIYFYLAATAYEGAQDTQKTLRWLNKITPANRLYGRSLHLRAQMLLAEKNYPETLKVLLDAQAASPEDPALALMQAHTLNQMKRFDDALAVLDQAIAQWPENPDIRYSKGMCLDLAGRKAEAMQLMEALATDLPEYYQALNYIGYSLAEQGKELPRALELLAKADSLSPNSAYILDSLAWAQFQAKQVEAAWKTIKQAISLEDSADPLIWEHYGDIAAAVGKKKEARTGYQKALDMLHEEPESLRKKMGQL